MTRSPFPALVRRGCPRVARAGAVCSKTKVPINKERFASIYKEPLRGTLNRPPPSAPSAQTPLLTKEGIEAWSLRPLQRNVAIPSSLLRNCVKKAKTDSLVTQKAQKK